MSWNNICWFLNFLMHVIKENIQKKKSYNCALHAFVKYKSPLSKVRKSIHFCFCQLNTFFLEICTLTFSFLKSTFFIDYLAL